ncbi:MAG: ATP-dependent DNA helicase Rep, partial [Burkholderiaceae bacterium]|nr:ATP-dependent DNA helicase Rep [Burkholderiaceae bacterium]
LRRAQIPYRVSGGQGFFDRAEIKDLCAWLRLLVNEDDDPAFLRAVATPKRGIGHQTLAQLGDFAARSRLSLSGALAAHSVSAALPARAVSGLREFARALDDLRHHASHATGADEARAFLLDWLQNLGYEKHLHDHADSPPQAAARWTNVLEFVDWMATRCDGQNANIRVRSLLEVAQTVSLISTLDEREQDPDMVTLSTLHAAKGLEWPHVVLAGAVEGLLPFRTDDDTGNATERAARIEEERRLMYVGITRAQRTLAVTWTRQRKRGREVIAAQPSRFIAEMALDQTTAREDPREKLKALRAEFARRTATSTHKNT